MLWTPRPNAQMLYLPVKIIMIYGQWDPHFQDIADHIVPLMSRDPEATTFLRPAGALPEARALIGMHQAFKRLAATERSRRHVLTISILTTMLSAEVHRYFTKSWVLAAIVAQSALGVSGLIERNKIGAFASKHCCFTGLEFYRYPHTIPLLQGTQLYGIRAPTGTLKRGHGRRVQAELETCQSGQLTSMTPHD